MGPGPSPRVHFNRHITICYMPVIWARPRPGPTASAGGCQGPGQGTQARPGPGPARQPPTEAAGPNKRTVTNCHCPLKWALGDERKSDSIECPIIIYHISYITYHISHVTYHILYIIYYILHIIYYILYSI